MKRWVWLAESRLLRGVERRVEPKDVVAVVSEADRVTLSEVAPRLNVLVAPNGWTDADPLCAAPTPTVSFVALLSWGPNVGAAVWFSQHVWPLVIGSIPEAKLQLVGRNPTDAVRSLASDSVIVTGTVDDLRPWYQDSTLCVAPLLAGGGSRLKILESLAYGRPVVATSIGVEGLEDLINEGVIVADDPVEMASRIVELLQQPARAFELGKSGARAVTARHSWDATLAPLMHAVELSLTVAT